MHNKRIGIFLTVFFLILIAHTFLFVIIVLNSIGDETLSASVLNLNKYLVNIIGFPASIFIKEDPFFFDNSDTWTVWNILLQLFNVLVQSALVLVLYNYFTARMKR